MLNATALTPQDLQGLSHSAVSELAASLLEQLQQAAVQIAQRDTAIKFKDAKIERITFELARLKAWRFAARTEAMNAQQRQMFEDTLAEDQASLEAQLQALQGSSPASEPPGKDNSKRKPRRQALPEHLRRVEHHHEPEDTNCVCGKPMVRSRSCKIHLSAHATDQRG